MIVSPASAIPLDANTVRWLGWNAQLLRQVRAFKCPRALFARRRDVCTKVRLGPSNRTRG